MDITIGQTIDFTILIASLISAVSVIVVAVTKIIDKQFEKRIDPINENIKSLDASQCKNFLVRFLADVENGEKLDEAEIERACETYDHYKNDLHQNSYIRRRWETLMNNERNDK